MKFWDSKIVSISGAASGIGFALAKELHSRGATVWLTDINSEAVQMAASSLGDKVRSSVLDVRDAAAFKAHVADVIESFGALDALFNNAGLGAGGLAHELDTSHFDQCAAVNITGVSNGCMAAYASMYERGAGIIVNTASAAGLLAVPGMTPYAMTKHAIVGLSKSLRIEAAERNIQVCALCPTAIDTPLLDNANPSGTPRIWMPNLRDFLTDMGGPPYPVDKFAVYALDQVEKNKGIIVAPFGARVRLKLAQVFPGVFEYMSRRAYRKQLSLRHGSP
ncbi:MAG: SDR family NAD(P)-dependent oxidoreductase [Pseudomonadales bacterium]